MRYLPWMFLAPKNVAFQGRHLWKSRVKLLIRLKMPGPVPSKILKNLKLLIVCVNHRGKKMKKY